LSKVHFALKFPGRYEDLSRTGISLVACSLILIFGLIFNINCISVESPKGPSGSPDTQVAPQPVSYQANVPINAAWTSPKDVSACERVALPIPEIVKKISKSVVAIHTDTTTYDIFLQPVPARGVGTGTIIDKAGYVLTNNHVVENAKTIKVILYNGKSYDALKVVRDPLTDLAVVQIPPDDLQVPEIGSCSELQVGEGVVAVGNALALEGGPTVTSGIVSYIGRSINVSSDIILHDLIQTDAAINPGNSGGPLLNFEGQVIGVNTATAENAQNIGFAIEITPSLPIIEQLIRQGHITRAYLGVELFTLDSGVGVIKVDSGSPAEKAGLRPGDIINQLNEKKVSSSAELREQVNSSTIGQAVRIDFSRGGKNMSVTATLTESPGPSAAPALSPST
jgi:serine protease Do